MERAELVKYHTSSEVSAVDISNINFENTKRIIELKENPHPLVVFILAIIVLLILLIIYIDYTRRDLSGVWITDDKKILTLAHSGSGVVNITDGPIKGNGYADGMGIYMDLYEPSGRVLKGIIYDGPNNQPVIQWIDYDTWHKVSRA